MSKPANLDVMSDVTGLMPLFNDFPRPETIKNKIVVLNLSNIKKTDSIGLAVLMGLVFSVIERTGSQFRIQRSNQSEINKNMDDLNFFEIFKEFVGNAYIENDLFREGVELENNVKTSNSSIQKIIFFNPDRANKLNRQETLNSFSKNIKEFLRSLPTKSFNHQQIISIFLELIKNTYDHSSGVGVMGACLKLNSNKVANEIRFIYCDTGEGVTLNVRRYYSNINSQNSDKTTKRKAEKNSAIDFLYEALQPGFSTKKGNGINHGMGLTLISQGAKGAGFNVKLRDADSFIELSDLTQPFTHSNMRSKSSKTNTPKLLVFDFEKVITS
jgi:hypothetical protein